MTAHNRIAQLQRHLRGAAVEEEDSSPVEMVPTSVSYDQSGR